MADLHVPSTVRISPVIQLICSKSFSMVVNRIVDAVCDTSEVSAGLGGKAGNDAIWDVDAMIPDQANPGEDNAWILTGVGKLLERSFGGVERVCIRYLNLTLPDQSSGADRGHGQ